MVTNYKRKNLNLSHPLAFFQHFDGAERAFWYDSQKNQYIIAAERLQSVKPTEIPNFPYVFYSKSFFDRENSELWSNFGNEIIAFRHYYVKNTDESYILTMDEFPEIDDKAVKIVNHKMTEHSSNLTEWQTFFNQIQANISSGQTEKIVASRQIQFTVDRNLSVTSMLQKLMDNNPNCFIFAYQKNEKCFIGASPEILVEKSNDKILSYALAGTLSKSIKNAAEILRNDNKNLTEHDIVVKQIQAKLSARSNHVKSSDLELLELKNVYHLKTLLTANSERYSLIDWAEYLHPTPALGGFPSQTALDFLQKHEPQKRGLYAAPLGFIDQNGNGTIVVGIRSALIVKTELYAYVGCGIVSQSDCQAEFDETQVKLKTIKEAF